MRLARLKMDVSMQSWVLGLLYSLYELGSVGLCWPQFPVVSLKGLVQVTYEKLLCIFREK